MATRRTRAAAKKPARRRTRTGALRLDVVMRAINEGVYDWDLVSKTVYYSDWVRRAVGLSAEELKTGQDWRNRIHPEDLRGYDEAIAAHLKGQTERLQCDYRYRANDGTWHWARQHGFALRDARGRAIRLIGSTGDITELKNAENALKTSEERYSLAMRAATEGVYEWDVASGRLYVSDTTKVFFWSKDTRLTPAAWNERVHPEDFAGYRNAIARHFIGEVPQFEHEYRIRDASGGWLWVLDRGIGVRDASGRVTKFIGAVSDITRRKLAEQELRRAHEDTREALEQQTATAEILKVISSSPTSIEPVFDSILENATRLCDAHLGFLSLYDGEMFRTVAHRGANPEFARWIVGRGRFTPSPGSGLDRMLAERAPVHIADYRESPPYRERFPMSIKLVELGGVRSYLAVPMLKEGRVIGGITIYRPEVRAFTRKQIDLVSTFASQAVIAIENVRLFKELGERNVALAHSLEQQTATAEILRVISSTPTDTQPVFDAIVKSALHLFGGLGVAVVLADDGRIEHAASGGGLFSDESVRKRFPMALNRESVSGQAILGGALVDIGDTEAAEAPEYARSNGRALGFRAIAGAPMMRESAAIGAIVVMRRDPGAFGDKQLQLLQTFADQAVIAIENARLFNETREALERQTATAEVLRAISDSIADTAPVFDTILENCERLFAGNIVGVNVVRADGMLHIGAYHGAQRAEFERVFPLPPSSNAGSWLAISERRAVHYPDAQRGDEVPAHTRQGCMALGIKAVIFAPLLREGRGLGAIFVGRDHVRAFSEKEIALLRTFADQAAIAIENVRLFKELGERNSALTRALEQQTAMGDVLRAISGSPTDVQPVLQALASRAAQLCGAAYVNVLLEDNAVLRTMAVHSGEGGPQPDLAFRMPATAATVNGRAFVERRVVHVEDFAALADTEYPDAKDYHRKFGFRTILGVPMLREGKPIGTISIWRLQVQPFRDDEIALMRTFADQAVIAIENVRLFHEVRAKSAELEVANRHKSEFLANMSHELRTPLNAVIGFSEALGERYFGELNEKQDEYVRDIHASGKHLLSLINDILDLSKIEAGRMELEASEFDLPAAIDNSVTLVKERAQRHGITLQREIDPTLARIHADERKLKQILLNLLSNAVKFTPDGGTVTIRARPSGEAVEIAVADTGPGIAPEDQAAVFEEFKQVGPASLSKAEGTGLGLPLAKRFVELHGGAMRLDSAPGKGATFTFTLPFRTSR